MRVKRATTPRPAAPEPIAPPGPPVVADWPDLRGLTSRLPESGTTLAELAAALEAAPLWLVLPTLRLAQFDALVRALQRSGPMWLAAALVRHGRERRAAWRELPHLTAADALPPLDARALVVAGADVMVAGEWWGRTGERLWERSIAR